MSEMQVEVDVTKPDPTDEQELPRLPPSTLAGGDVETEFLSPRRLALRRFRRHKLAMGALLVLVVIGVLAAFAPAIAPFGETEQNLDDTLQSPDSTYWLGTDTLGRDTWSRILFGARISLMVGLSVALLSAVLGTVVGVVAGYSRGWIDAALMRLTDTMLAMPALIVFIVAARIYGRSVTAIVIIMGLFFWMPLARIIRGQVLSLREREFVEAAHALGASGFRIVTRHMLPNLTGLIIVNITLATGIAILLESTLSFLGAGIDPVSAATWGNLLNGAEGFVTTAPWLVWAPGMAIVITVLAINFVGDGLRDALDPAHRQG